MSQDAAFRVGLLNTLAASKRTPLPNPLPLGRGEGEESKVLKQPLLAEAAGGIPGGAAIEEGEGHAVEGTAFQSHSTGGDF